MIPEQPRPNVSERDGYKPAPMDKAFDAVFYAFMLLVLGAGIMLLLLFMATIARMVFTGGA